MYISRSQYSGAALKENPLGFTDTTLIFEFMFPTFHC
jgi:hypothetical protein